MAGLENDLRCDEKVPILWRDREERYRIRELECEHEDREAEFLGNKISKMTVEEMMIYFNFFKPKNKRKRPLTDEEAMAKFTKVMERSRAEAIKNRSTEKVNTEISTEEEEIDPKDEWRRILENGIVEPFATFKGAVQMNFEDIDESVTNVTGDMKRRNWKRFYKKDN